MLLKLVMGWAELVILSLLMMCPLTGIVCAYLGALYLLLSVIVVSGSISCFFSSAADGLDILSDLLAFLSIYLNVKICIMGFIYFDHYDICR